MSKNYCGPTLLRKVSLFTIVDYFVQITKETSLGQNKPGVSEIGTPIVMEILFHSI